jgi:hypothetical protein
VVVNDGVAVARVRLGIGVTFVGVNDPVEPQAAKPIDSPIAVMASPQGRIRNIAVFLPFRLAIGTVSALVSETPRSPFQMTLVRQESRRS